MSLDLYILKRGHPTKCIHQISHENYLLLRPAFCHIWRETGIDIDICTDTKIATGLPDLITSLEDSLNEENNQKIRAEIRCLLRALMNAQKQHCAVGFFGKLVLSSQRSGNIYAAA